MNVNVINKSGLCPICSSSTSITKNGNLVIHNIPIHNVLSRYCKHCNQYFLTDPQLIVIKKVINNLPCKKPIDFKEVEKSKHFNWKRWDFGVRVLYGNKNRSKQNNSNPSCKRCYYFNTKYNEHFCTQLNKTVNSTDKACKSFVKNQFSLVSGGRFSPK